jgi:hypothetical protein
MKLMLWKTFKKQGEDKFAVIYFPQKSCSVLIRFMLRADVP